MDALGLIGFAQSHGYSVKLLNTECAVKLGPKYVNAVGSPQYPYGPRNKEPFELSYTFWRFNFTAGSGQIFALFTRTGDIRYIWFDPYWYQGADNSGWDKDAFLTDVGQYKSNPYRRYPLKCATGIYKYSGTYEEHVPEDPSVDIMLSVTKLKELDDTDYTVKQEIDLEKCTPTAHAELFAMSSYVSLLLYWNFWPITGFTPVGTSSYISYHAEAYVIQYLKGVILTPN